MCVSPRWVATRAVVDPGSTSRCEEGRSAEPVNRLEVQRSDETQPGAAVVASNVAEMAEVGCVPTSSEQAESVEGI